MRRDRLTHADHLIVLALLDPVDIGFLGAAAQ